MMDAQTIRAMLHEAGARSGAVTHGAMRWRTDSDFARLAPAADRRRCPLAIAAKVDALARQHTTIANNARARRAGSSSVPCGSPS
jgi:hypothetical protein